MSFKRYYFLNSIDALLQLNAVFFLSLCCVLRNVFVFTNSVQRRRTNEMLLVVSSDYIVAKANIKIKISSHNN